MDVADKMELEEKWRCVFSHRAAVFNTPHEISHWTEKGYLQRRKKIGGRIRKVLKKGHRVLDLGSGPGHYASFFESPVIMDYSLGVLRKTPAAARVLPVCADIRAFPFRKGAFDGLLSVGLLQCLRLKEADLRETAQALKSGGWFIVETLNCEWKGLLDGLPLRARKALDRFCADPEPAPSWFVHNDFVMYQADKLTALFKRAGLMVEKVEYVYSVLPAPLAAVGELMAGLGLGPLRDRDLSRSFVLYGRKAA